MQVAGKLVPLAVTSVTSTGVRASLCALPLLGRPQVTLLSQVFCLLVLLYKVPGLGAQALG